MTTTDKLFSFNGRLRRMDWWMLGIAVGFAGLLVGLAVRLILGRAAAGIADDATGYWTYVLGDMIVSLPFVWAQTALSAKRMHDLNITAAPVVIFSVLLVAVSVTPFGMIPAGWPVSSAQAIAASNIATLAMSLVFLVLLGCIDGRRGPNRFGPSPKYRQDQPAFIAPGGLD